MNSKKEQNTIPDQRAEEILDVIMSYAQLNFSNKVHITGKDDMIDAISAGINMLGEELESYSLSIKEKEHLLREIHHRVKNNMQIISSLLNLLCENQKDQKFLALVNDCQNRITAMSLIHEMLYATSDFRSTNLNEYITSLSKSLYASFSVPGNNITVKTDIDKNVFFDIDKMIPLGLILNEIISNSLKYAFPENNGSLTITLLRGNPGRNYGMKLIVSDDGIGLPEDFDIINKGGLGMQLICLLSEQIGCSTKKESVPGKGLTYTLELD